MRPAVWSLTFLSPRGLHRETPRPMVEEPLQPIVPGAWAAWARSLDAVDGVTRDHAPAMPARSTRRPAFHTTRS
jgi:hypothetical protein